MSKDNSQVARNELNRSFFTQELPTYTSQRIGQIGVSCMSFGLPSETQKLVQGKYYEMKPLVGKLNTQVKANELASLCYFSDLWDNWDKFIGKGSLLLRNGAFNVPYIEAQNEETNYTLPYVRVDNLINGFLATSFGPCSKLYQPVHKQRAESAEGNKVPYNYHFFTQLGRFFDSAQDTDVRTAIEDIGWWIPKLVGAGYNTSQWNLRLINTGHGTDNYEMFLNTTKPEIVTLAKVLYAVNMKASAQATDDIVILDGSLSEYRAVSIGISHYNGALSYSITLVKNVFETATDRNNWSNIDFGAFTFAPVVATSNDICFQNGVVLTSLASVPNNYIEHTNSTYHFKDDNGVLPFFFIGNSGDNSALRLGYSFLVTALLNSPELLGNGSLMESMGHSLFEERTVYDILSNYAEDYDNAALGFAYDSTFSIFALDLSDMVGQRRVSLLPYVGYHKIVTERLLLPHQILSNNEGNTSALNDKWFDSPYWRNNLIPTKLYGQIGYSGDYMFYNSILKTIDNEYNAGVQKSDFDPEVWSHAVGACQILALFCARGTLMDMDVFTKIWQKQDRNLQDLLQTAEIAIVDNDDIMQAKKFAITKALTKFSLFGQLDQMATSVLENHFGIKSAPKNGTSVMLARNQFKLPTIDIFNTGGSVDASGNAQMLGERTNIVSNSYPRKKVFEVFCKDYCFIYNLHWFSVPTTRQNVPNAGNRLIEKATWANDVRFAWNIATFPEFQNTGDEQLMLADIENWVDDSLVVSWTNKNNTLKDGFGQMLGEFKTNKYHRQIITPYPAYRRSLVAPSLTYAYLQPTPFDYDVPLVDKFGSAFLIEFENIVLKKSPMTKNGLSGIF